MQHYRSRFALIAGLCILAAPAADVSALAQMPDARGTGQNVVMVGGAPMYPARNIVQNAINSKDHTTLVAAVKAGGLVDTLQGPGPFTVFAPTNEAFAKLPPGTVGSLLKPENKRQLVKILTYHVVAGRYTAADLKRMVHQGAGEAKLTTVEGDPLTLTLNGNHLFVEGENGGVAEVTIPNVMQSNGVIHVVSSVLLPN